VHCSCDAEKLKFNSVGGDFGSRKSKRHYSGNYGAFLRGIPLAGLWIQAVDFVFVLLAGIWLKSH
jgi:hypothetical protein